MKSLWIHFGNEEIDTFSIPDNITFIQTEEIQEPLKFKSLMKDISHLVLSTINLDITETIRIDDHNFGND